LSVRGVLFDLDGTIYTDTGLVPGVLDTLRALRTRRIPYRFVTNTTGRSRRELQDRLLGYGFEARPDEILTPVLAAVAVCRERGHGLIAPLVPEGTLEDFDGLALAGGISGRSSSSIPAAVVIGDLGELWTFRLLQEAFSLVLGGAELIALSRDRFWHKAGRLELDAGPFVAALEYATGKAALVTGKPSTEFYRAAVSALGLPPEVPGGEVVMVGDDLWSDVQGAQRSGLRGWLVRTGKFREQQLEESGIRPDRILESAADVASLVDL
jgi:HAD superfamily hydrolase (TIGR01458 family)